MTGRSTRLLGAIGLATTCAGLAAAPMWLVMGGAIVAAIAAAPVLGLVAASIAVPFGSPWSVAVGAGALTAAPVLLLLTAYVSALRDVAGRRLPQLPVGPVRRVLAALAVYVGVLAVSSAVAPDLGRAALETARWLVFGLAIVLASVLPARRAWLWLVVAALLVAGAAEAGLGVIASGRGEAMSFSLPGGGAARAYGTFGQPNPFGAYMNLVWPVGAALAAAWMTRRAVPAWVGFLGACAAVAAVAGLVWSWSRGAWLAAAAAGAAMGVVWLASALRPPLQARRVAAAWLGGVAVLAAFAAGLGGHVPDALAGRVSSVSSDASTWDVADAEVTDASFATVERLAHWHAAISMFEASPWVGQGPGHYEVAYARYRLPRWSEPLGHAHNYYLHVLAETGMPGLAAYLVLLLALVSFSVGAATRPATPSQEALGLGLVGVVACVAVHSVVDHVFVHDMVVHLGLLIGLVAASGGDA